MWNASACSSSEPGCSVLCDVASSVGVYPDSSLVSRMAAAWIDSFMSLRPRGRNQFQEVRGVESE